MPGAVVERDELLDLTVTPQQQVCGDAQNRALAEFRMCLGRQVPGEQPRDPRSAEFTRRQADSVQYDEVRRDSRGTFVEVRRKNLFDSGHEAGADVDAHGDSSRPSYHSSVPQ